MQCAARLYIRYEESTSDGTECAPETGQLCLAEDCADIDGWQDLNDNTCADYQERGLCGESDDFMASMEVDGVNARASHGLLLQSLWVVPTAAVS